MAFGRPPIGRRALLAATIGAIYSLLLLPAPGTLLGINALGLAWFLLSVGLLFLTPLAFHAYSAWCILWVIWKIVEYTRDPGLLALLLVDLIVPAASLVLLLTSGYLPLARAHREAELGAA